MTVKIYGQEIDCARAVKGPDFVRLYDADGGVICRCSGITDFAGYEIIGGIWSTDLPSKFTLPLYPDCTGIATYTGLGDDVTIVADVTTAYHIGTLPYGYRPTADSKIQATCPGGPGILVIAGADGAVNLETPQPSPVRVVFRG